MRVSDKPPALTPTLSRRKRELICAVLEPAAVSPLSLWERARVFADDNNFNLAEPLT